MPIAYVIAEPGKRRASLANAAVGLASIGSVATSTGVADHDSAILRIDLAGGDPRGIRAVLARSFAPCDVLVTSEPVTPPKLLVSDMDSTIIGQECIDELADYAGIKPQIAAITDRAMRGALDFTEALRERVALLAGLAEATIARCLRERIRPNAGAGTLVAQMKAGGCRTVLVTGGFHHFADPLAAELGFDRVVGNRLEVENGRLTGNLVGPIMDAAAKARVLAEERALLGPAGPVAALGDGANDAPMLAAADYGIAYHAKPVACAAANASIEWGDLGNVARLTGAASGAARNR